MMVLGNTEINGKLQSHGKLQSQQWNRNIKQRNKVTLNITFNIIT